MKASDVQKELRKFANPQKAKFFPRFFKTGKGEYGEGDKFIGVTVPNQRRVAMNFMGLPLKGIEQLLKSKIHEHRLTALFILVNQFKRSDPKTKIEIYNFYLANTKFVNNWDLVDSSASYIVGKYLYDQGPSLHVSTLERLAKSESLWERRIAMLAAGEFIKHDRPEIALKIAKMLLSDKHDLIHKAVGWMLREVGKRDQKLLEMFLKANYKQMPRTALRYAIEKFPQDLRLKYLKNPDVSS